MNNLNWWEPRLYKKDLKLLNEVISKNFVNEGDFNSLFENKISKILKTKYVCTTTSGTSALFLALKAINIKHNDEVLIPNCTFIATANAVRLAGAKCVFIDIDPKSLNLNPELIEQKITKKTKAIIPVHISGRACDLVAIKKIANKFKLKIIEDAAEAFNSNFNDKKLGTIGDIGCFSLSPNKIITTGQGGFLTTNSLKLYTKIKQLKDQGRFKRGSGGKDLHKFEGFNFKFNDIQASIGLGQLNYINSRTDHQKRMYNIYYDKLSKLNFISFYKFNTDMGELPLWIDVKLENINKFIKYLEIFKIPYRKFWLPITTQKEYFEKEMYPNAFDTSKNSLWLPSSFNLTFKQINYICKIIQKFK